MSRIHYPSREQIDEQVKVIIQKSEMFSDTIKDEPEYGEVTKYVPVKNRYARGKNFIRLLAVAAALVMVLAISYVSELSHNNNSFKPLSSGETEAETEESKEPDRYNDFSNLSDRQIQMQKKEIAFKLSSDGSLIMLEDDEILKYEDYTADHAGDEPYIAYATFSYPVIDQDSFMHILPQNHEVGAIIEQIVEYREMEFIKRIQNMPIKQLDTVGAFYAERAAVIETNSLSRYMVLSEEDVLVLEEEHNIYEQELIADDKFSESCYYDISISSGQLMPYGNLLTDKEKGEQEINKSILSGGAEKYQDGYSNSEPVQMPEFSDLAAYIHGCVWSISKTISGTKEDTYYLNIYADWEEISIPLNQLFYIKQWERN